METKFAGSRQCDSLGKYAGLYKIVDYDPGQNLMCIHEMGVYTTIDIVPEDVTEVRFEGTSEHDKEVLYGSFRFIPLCDQVYEGTNESCFYVDTEGWLEIDFGGTTMISAFILLSNGNLDY